MADLTKARKEHKCCLCKELIAKGSEYVRTDVTPWNSHGEVFWTYKAHTDCDRTYSKVAHLCDYQVPYDANDWREIVEMYEYEQKRKGA